MDASHEKFGKLFMQTLKDQLKKAGRGVDYIVVSLAFKHAGRCSGSNQLLLLWHIMNSITIHNAPYLGF